MIPFQPIRSWLWAAGCLVCGASVVAGAAGGHKREWPEWKKHNLNEATKYGLANGLGILLSSLVSKTVIPGTLLLLGTLAFSGPLLYRSFTDDGKFGKITPFGGFAIITAWTLMIFL